MEENTYDQREAIRAWTVERVTLVLDSERRIYDRLTAVASEAVVSDMGTGVGRDDYEAMLRGGGAPGYQREDYERVAGAAVVAELGEIVEEWGEGTPGVAHMLLTDLLDLGDTRQADHFGHHFLPEAVDDIPWPESDPQPRS